MSDNLILKAAEIEAAVMAGNAELKEQLEKANEEIAIAKSTSADTKSAIDAISEKNSDLVDRLIELEQRGETTEDEVALSIGEQFVKSDGYVSMLEGRQSATRMDIKTAIINTFPASTSQPLVQGDRLSGINATPNRRLTLRDLIPVTTTNSNLVEFTRENAFTNNAGPQRDTASPMAAIENVAKNESAITFTLATEAIITLAHFIPLSKQVVADSPALMGYVNGRLMYGLKLKEETQILKGLGTGSELNGLQTQATAYIPESPQLTNEIDIIRDAITQAQVAEYSPNFIVLNPADWDSIQRRKVGSSDDRYVFGDPAISWAATPLWGLTPIVTNSQTSGTFLLGDTNGAMLFDREQAAVEMSFENSDNFTKNMVTVRAEERLALAVFRTESLITGSL